MHHNQLINTKNLNNMDRLLHIMMLLGLVNNMFEARDLFVVLVILFELCILFNPSQPTCKPARNNWASYLYPFSNKLLNVQDHPEKEITKLRWKSLKCDGKRRQKMPSAGRFESMRFTHALKY